MGGGIKKEDRRCACPLMFLKINFQNLIIIHTCGGEAPAHILAVYSCLDSPTVYSVLVGVALSLHFQALFCYENLPPEGRNDPARPEGRLKDSISCWFRRNRAGHQVPSPVLSGVSGNHVFFCPY